MSSEPAPPIGAPAASFRPAGWPLAIATGLSVFGCRWVGMFLFWIFLEEKPLLPGAWRIGAAWGVLFGAIVSVWAWWFARRRWAGDPGETPPAASVAAFGGLFVVGPPLLGLVCLAQWLYSTGSLPAWRGVLSFAPWVLILAFPFTMALGLCAGGLAAAIWRLAVLASMRWPERTDATPATDRDSHHSSSPDDGDCPYLSHPQPRRWPLPLAAMLVAGGFMEFSPWIISSYLPPLFDPAVAARIGDVAALVLGLVLSFAVWHRAGRSWAQDPRSRPPLAMTGLLAGLLLAAAPLAVVALLALCGILLGPLPASRAVFDSLALTAAVLVTLGLLIGAVAGALAGLVCEVAAWIATRKR